MIRRLEQTDAAATHGGLFGLTRDALRALFAEWAEPAYRVDQLLRWVYIEGADEYEQMTNLPKALRIRLAEFGPIYQSTIVRRQESADGTIKLLLRWPDTHGPGTGGTTECVLIPDQDRRTACISTQVGCPVGCVFCASGLDGLERDLSAAQIVEQAMRVRQISEPGLSIPSRDQSEPGASAPLNPASPGALARAEFQHSNHTPIPSTNEANRQPLAAGECRGLTNVVFMGLGEPLANYDATLQAVRAINADWGMGIGARKITVSTVGLPKQMQQLADEKLQITLALSLHAPTDELRQELIPWARGITIDALIEAANYYFEQTGREITLEYILLGGLNDSSDHAAALARVSRRMRSNVNLIAYNPVAGLPYARPTPDAIRSFVGTLRDRGVNAHVRRSRGLDIDSACGQLRRKVEANAPTL